ncbi:hypothetical protein ABIA22_005400 [Sinorhizobium fredii]
MEAGWCWRADPLWPAGHLPHKGGESKRPIPAPTDTLQCNASVKVQSVPQIFSPLVGEMAGSPEGVNKRTTDPP